MSNVNVQYISNKAWNAAVTIAFSESSLLFIKQFAPMINRRGTYHLIDLFPFFCLSYELANINITHITFANAPRIMRLNPQGRDVYLRLALGRGF